MKQCNVGFDIKPESDKTIASICERGRERGLRVKAFEVIVEDCGKEGRKKTL